MIDLSQTSTSYVIAAFAFAGSILSLQTLWILGRDRHIQRRLAHIQSSNPAHSLADLQSLEKNSPADNRLILTRITSGAKTSK